MDWVDIVFRGIERFGVPTAVMGFFGWLVLKLWRRGEHISDNHLSAVKEHAAKIAEISKSNNEAWNRNTEATDELTKTLKEKLGSDPAGLCKLEKVLEDGGFHCTADEVKLVLERYLAKQQQKRKDGDKR